MLTLFVLELPLSIAALALYGIAQPDLYRTRLWQEGANHGWNSSPNEIIYAYANYRPIPNPLPWSQFITNFNVVIAVLSVFLLLVKGIMFITLCGIHYCRWWCMWSWWRCMGLVYMRRRRGI